MYSSVERHELNWLRKISFDIADFRLRRLIMRIEIDMSMAKNTAEQRAAARAECDGGNDGKKHKV